MGKKKKERVDTSGNNRGALGSLGGFLQSAGFQASDSPEQKKTPSQIPASSWQELLAQQKGLHLRVERKGRKGKTVTIVYGFQMGETPLAEVARAMSKSLGCGSTLEGSDDMRQIVLQGDNRDRVGQWLQRNGASWS